MFLKTRDIAGQLSLVGDMQGTLIIALQGLWVFYSHSLGVRSLHEYVITCRSQCLQSGFFCSLPYLSMVSIMVHVSMLGFTGLQCDGVWAVILLQIIMVSPVTHLEKNHKSLSITDQSQFFLKKQGVLKSKCLSFLVNRQLTWRQTPKLFDTAY